MRKEQNNIISKVPKWMKLDNAATIYPPTMSKTFASMFRFTVTLKEQIDPVLLDTALKNIMPRFPSFSYQLRSGLFWCYFTYIDDLPIVTKDVANPLLRINLKSNKNFLFRIRYFDKRIAIEVFHALTDGTGGITFLLTLTGEYLRLQHDLNITYDDKVLNPIDEPSKEEYEDSFNVYAKNEGSLVHEKPAYHLPGVCEEDHFLNIITGIIPLKEIKKLTNSYNCTVTEFITSLMISTIQKVKEEKHDKSKKEIKITVPINLRNIYPSKTLRNFSSYANVGIETRYGHYSLEEIIKEVKSQMGLFVNEKKLNAKISGNVKITKNYFIRLIPMFIKKYILSYAEYLMGDRYCSQTLSNIGLINVPLEMKKYIAKMNFILGKSRRKSGSCSCISFQDNLYISFSRKIKESDMERIFFTSLVEMGIPVEIESNGR